MYQNWFIIFCLTIATAAAHNECHDNLWQNDTLINGCCKSINSENITDEEITRIAEACYQDSAQDECDIIKCVLREEGAMAGDKINATAVVVLTLRGKNEQVWGKVVNDAVKSCMEKMAKEKHPEDFFIDCLDDTMLVNCPKSEWTENDTCAKLKKAVAACI